jgi:hypothetical protein
VPCRGEEFFGFPTELKAAEKLAELLGYLPLALDHLYELNSQHQRIMQARLTNLTWLRKCAKERGDEDEVRKLYTERIELKVREKQDNACRNVKQNGHGQDDVMAL